MSPAVLAQTVDHLRHNVLDAAADYEQAENALTAAYNANAGTTSWEPAARTAKRRAAELAIAIDGLVDRASRELSISKTAVREEVSTLCATRPNGFERVWAVANAYKHDDLTDPRMVIQSNSDVLIVALGWGLDGWGVGKFGGVEVIVRDKSGTQWKFMGDVPVVVRGWHCFLAARGAILPAQPVFVCGVQAYP